MSYPSYVILDELGIKKLVKDINQVPTVSKYRSKARLGQCIKAVHKSIEFTQTLNKYGIFNINFNYNG